MHQKGLRIDTKVTIDLLCSRYGGEHTVGTVSSRRLSSRLTQLVARPSITQTAGLWPCDPTFRPPPSNWGRVKSVGLGQRASAWAMLVVRVMVWRRRWPPPTDRYLSGVRHLSLALLFKLANHGPTNKHVPTRASTRQPFSGYSRG